MRDPYSDANQCIIIAANLDAMGSPVFRQILDNRNYNVHLGHAERRQKLRTERLAILRVIDVPGTVKRFHQTPGTTCGPVGYPLHFMKRIGIISSLDGMDGCIANSAAELGKLSRRASDCWHTFPSHARQNPQKLNPYEKRLLPNYGERLSNRT